jgi:MFS family permease
MLSLCKYPIHGKQDQLMTSDRTITTSVLVPSLPLIEVEFNVVREVAILGLSLYTAGLAFGPLIAAPLSEIFGRRPVYLVCFVLLIVFTAGSGASQNIQQLLILRFLAGTLGSGAIAIGAG